MPSSGSLVSSSESSDQSMLAMASPRSLCQSLKSPLPPLTLNLCLCALPALSDHLALHHTGHCDRDWVRRHRRLRISSSTYPSFNQPSPLYLGLLPPAFFSPAISVLLPSALSWSCTGLARPVRGKKTKRGGNARFVFGSARREREGQEEGR